MADELTPEKLEELKAELRKEVENEVRQEIESDGDTAELAEKIADEKLAKMKANMDAMDKKLKATIAENIKLQEKAKEEARKQLEEEGKTVEARDMQIVELQEKLSMSEEKLNQFERNSVVDKAVQGLEFFDGFTKEVAVEKITSQLVKDEEGRWTHKSGASIEDFVKVFAKDDKYKALFKPKENQGTGTPPRTGVSKGTKKPLSEMTTQEMLEAAARGEFGESPL